MKYEDIVADWNNLRDDDRRLWHEISDRERIEFALSLAGKIENQEPVAYLYEHREITGAAGYLKACRAPTFEGAFPVYRTPQPCPPASVFVAGNRVSTVIFASRKDADAYVASVPASAGVVISEVPLVGPVAPCPECEKLKKQVSAYKNLTSSLEKQVAHHSAKADEYQAAIATLESERQSNEILTAECENLKADASELRGCRDLNKAVIKTLTDEVDRLRFELKNLAGAQTNISAVAQIDKLKAERDITTNILNRVRYEAHLEAADLVIDLGDDSSTFDARTLAAAANAIRALTTDMEAGECKLY